MSKHCKLTRAKCHLCEWAVEPNEDVRCAQCFMHFHRGCARWTPCTVLPTDKDWLCSQCTKEAWKPYYDRPHCSDCADSHLCPYKIICLGCKLSFSQSCAMLSRHEMRVLADAPAPWRCRACARPLRARGRPPGSKNKPRLLAKPGVGDEKAPKNGCLKEGARLVPEPALKADQFARTLRSAAGREVERFTSVYLAHRPLGDHETSRALPDMARALGEPHAPLHELNDTFRHFRRKFTALLKVLLYPHMHGRPPDEAAALALQRAPAWLRDAEQTLLCLPEALQDCESPGWLEEAQRTIAGPPTLIKSDTRSVLDSIVQDACAASMRSAEAVRRLADKYAISERRLRDVWSDFVSLSVRKLQALASLGCTPPALELRAPEWAAADTELLHSPEPQQWLVYELESGAAASPLRSLLALVRGFRLEQRDAPRPLRLRRWAAALAAYRDRGLSSSLIMLQRRWHELKLETRLRVLAYWQKGRPVPVPVLQLVAARYPYVVTQPMQSWRALVRSGQVLRATEDELKTLKPLEPLPAADDDDVIIVETENTDVIPPKPAQQRFTIDFKRQQLHDQLNRDIQELKNLGELQNLDLRSHINDYEASLSEVSNQINGDVPNSDINAISSAPHTNLVTKQLDSNMDDEPVDERMEASIANMLSIDPGAAETSIIFDSDTDDDDEFNKMIIDEDVNKANGQDGALDKQNVASASENKLDYNYDNSLKKSEHTNVDNTALVANEVSVVNETASKDHVCNLNVDQITKAAHETDLASDTISTNDRFNSSINSNIVGDGENEMHNISNTKTPNSTVRDTGHGHNSVSQAATSTDDVIPSNASTERTEAANVSLFRQSNSNTVANESLNKEINIHNETVEQLTEKGLGTDEINNSVYCHNRNDEDLVNITNEIVQATTLTTDSEETVDNTPRANTVVTKATNDSFKIVENMIADNVAVESNDPQVTVTVDPLAMEEGTCGDSSGEDNLTMDLSDEGGARDCDAKLTLFPVVPLTRVDQAPFWAHSRGGSVDLRGWDPTPFAPPPRSASPRREAPAAQSRNRHDAWKALASLIRLTRETRRLAGSVEALLPLCAPCSVTLERLPELAKYAPATESSDVVETTNVADTVSDVDVDNTQFDVADRLTDVMTDDVVLPTESELARVLREMSTAPRRARHCCAARRHRALVELRRRTMREDAPYHTDTNHHKTAHRNEECNCCCKNLLQHMPAAPLMLRRRARRLLRVLHAALASPRDSRRCGRRKKLLTSDDELDDDNVPTAREGPRRYKKRKKGDEGEKDRAEGGEEGGKMNPYDEWIRQRNITTRFFTLVPPANVKGKLRTYKHPKNTDNADTVAPADNADKADTVAAADNADKADTVAPADNADKADTVASADNADKADTVASADNADKADTVAAADNADKADTVAAADKPDTVGKWDHTYAGNTGKDKGAVTFSETKNQADAVLTGLAPKTNLMTVKELVEKSQTAQIFNPSFKLLSGQAKQQNVVHAQRQNNSKHTFVNQNPAILQIGQNQTTRHDASGQVAQTTKFYMVYPQPVLQGAGAGQPPTMVILPVTISINQPQFVNQSCFDNEQQIVTQQQVHNKYVAENPVLMNQNQDTVRILTNSSVQSQNAVQSLADTNTEPQAIEMAGSVKPHPSSKIFREEFLQKMVHNLSLLKGPAPTPKEPEQSSGEATAAGDAKSAQRPALSMPTISSVVSLAPIDLTEDDDNAAQLKTVTVVRAGGGASGARVSAQAAARVSAQAAAHEAARFESAQALFPAPSVRIERLMAGADTPPFALLRLDARAGIWTLPSDEIVVTDTAVSCRNVRYYVINSSYPCEPFRVQFGARPAASAPASAPAASAPEEREERPQPRIKVKSFAKMPAEEAAEAPIEVSDEEDTSLDLVTAGDKLFKKLSDSPPIYARVLTGVCDVMSALMLARSGRGLHAYCARADALLPVHAEPAPAHPAPAHPAPAHSAPAQPRALRCARPHVARHIADRFNIMQESFPSEEHPQPWTVADAP